MQLEEFKREEIQIFWRCVSALNAAQNNVLGHEETDEQLGNIECIHANTHQPRLRQQCATVLAEHRFPCVRA